jgi:hypothetical protein
MRAQLLIGSVITASFALPVHLFAQTAPAPAPPTIVACEGPDMPSLCPRPSDTALSQAQARADLAKRQDMATLMDRQLMAQRQALLRGVTPAPAHPPLAPVYQSFQPNPYLAPIAPPDFKGAAQVLGNVVSGGPHD